VLCGDAHALQRTTSAATRAGLGVHARCDVLPREEKAALFSVWTLRRGATDCSISVITLRSMTGEPTADASRLREFCGFAKRIS
jgi:hypothetical protein